MEYTGISIEQMMDKLWDICVSLFSFCGESFFLFTSFFHFLGAAATIFLLAACTVCFTKILNRILITKRFLLLEKEFLYWKALRDEAVQITAHTESTKNMDAERGDKALNEQREKGKRMARNIDRAELNKAYYDYFFEGFMLNLARKVIPIIFMIGFINESYPPQTLTALFGRTYIFALPSSPPLLIGAIFWYGISLLICYVFWEAGARYWSMRPKK